MTYQELKDYLNELPNDDEKLKDDVTIYDSEFSSVVDLMTHNGNDVLHDNHLYFAFQID